MAEKTARYAAVGTAPYHYAGGVICPGESADLTDDDAARGLASGQIVVTDIPAKAPPAAPQVPPTTPQTEEC